MIRNILLLISIILIFQSCDKQKSNVSIKGLINGGEKNIVYLEDIDDANHIIKDSFLIKGNNKFKLKAYVDDLKFYNIRIADENIVIMVKPGEKIKIKGKIDNLGNNYDIKGSKASKIIQNVNRYRYNIIKKLDSIKKDYIKTDISKWEKKEKLNDEWKQLIRQHYNNVIASIESNINNPGIIYALYSKDYRNKNILSPITNIEIFRKVDSSLSNYFPNSRYVQALKNEIDNSIKTINDLAIRNFIDNAESELPNIKLPNVKDKDIELNNIKNKYILLDFTVLNHKDSFQHTRNLKTTYDKYKNKGFEIYQVCVDKNKNLWKEIINSMGIKWFCVWDKESVDSRNLAIWNIKTIPANYIISPKSEIVGKNLFGKRLEERLEQLIK